MLMNPEQFRLVTTILQITHSSTSVQPADNADQLLSINLPFQTPIPAIINLQQQGDWQSGQLDE